MKFLHPEQGSFEITRNIEKATCNRYAMRHIACARAGGPSFALRVCAGLCQVNKLFAPLLNEVSASHFNSIVR